MEKLFWLQFFAPNHPVPLNDHMKQLVELHNMAGMTMKDLIVRLWPVDPIPSSNFGLVKKLVEVSPRVDAIKHSSCI